MSIKKKKRKIHERKNVRFKPVKELYDRTGAGKLAVVTVNLSKKTIKWLNYKVKEGFYSSRSMAIRLAIRDFIKHEEGFIKFLGKIKEPDDYIPPEEERFSLDLDAFKRIL